MPLKPKPTPHKTINPSILRIGNVVPLPWWSKRTKTHPAQAGVDLHQPILECWSLVQPLLECCACRQPLLECWPLLRLRSKVLPRYRGLRDRPGDPQEGRSEERR